MKGIPDFIWIENYGRDREGDCIRKLRLLWADGRVLASVDLPQLGEMTFEAQPEAGWVKGFGSPDQRVQFFELAPAKRWCEQYAASWVKQDAAKRKTKRRSRTKAG